MQRPRLISDITSSPGKRIASPDPLHTKDTHPQHWNIGNVIQLHHCRHADPVHSNSIDWTRIPREKDFLPNPSITQFIVQLHLVLKPLQTILANYSNNRSARKRTSVGCILHNNVFRCGLMCRMYQSAVPQCCDFPFEPYTPDDLISIAVALYPSLVVHEEPLFTGYTALSIALASQLAPLNTKSSVRWT